MSKLELKHIVGYLPYKLPAKLSQQGIFNLDREYPYEDDRKLGYLSDFCFNDGEFTGAIKVSEKIYYDVEEGDYEIVLRPLSELTKEIEHNGEKFVPLEKMLKKAMNEYDQGEGCFLAEYIQEFSLHTGLCVRASLGEENCFYIRYYKESKIFSLFTSQGIDVHLSHDYLEQLYEWHFDVHGLIDTGLAINKNTLP